MARKAAEPTPADVGRFAPVVRTIQKSGAPAGWRKGRDICLRDWESLKDDGMNAYAVLKLAIEMDRHAMFAEVAADKSRNKYDEAAYAEYQRYLGGETENAPAAGVAPSTRGRRVADKLGIAADVDEPAADAAEGEANA